MSRIPRLLSPLVFALFLFILAMPRIAHADDEDEERAAFANGETLRQRGDYATAAKWYERALPLAIRVFGPGHYNTAVVMNNLGMVYRDLGQYAKAEPLFQHSLKIYEANRGPNHPDVALCLNNLAILYDYIGQYAKAEPLYLRSLKIREGNLGPNHPDVAQSLMNLANLYKDMGQYAKVEPLHLRSLKIYEANLGPDHPLVADSLNGLANLYETMGRYAQAEPLYLRSLKILEAQLGPDHPRVATILNNLAILYYDLGQYDKAEPLYLRSLKIKEAEFGPDHTDVAGSLMNLANLYKAMGENAKAEPLYLRSLKIFEAQLGPDHPALASSLDNLAALYEEMGQYAKAMPLYQRDLRIREARLGSDHPLVARSLNNLANLYRAMGQYTQAEPLFQRSLKILEANLGPDHPDVALFVLYNLARLHASTDHQIEAAEEFDRMRRIVRRHVARVLPVLSEKEQLKFLQTQDEGYFHIALSLGLHERGDATIVARSAGWILNGKGVAQEALAERALLARDSSDPALDGIVHELLSIRGQLAALSVTAPKPGQEEARREQLDQLNQQEQALSRRLGQATGRNTTDDPWVEPSAVRKALPKDAVLIEIARFRVGNFQAKGNDADWSAAHYAAWIIPAEGQGEIKIVDLGEAEKIDDAVKAARAALEKAEKVIQDKGESDAEDQLREPMQALARLVFEPLIEQVGKARQLILSPDAALWLVPWGALPLADGKYTIEKYQIRYVISGRDLASQPNADQFKPTVPVLFADPDYDLDPSQAAADTAAVLRRPALANQLALTRGGGSFIGLARVPRLPGTAAEAQAIEPKLKEFAQADPLAYLGQFALEGVFKALHRPRVLVMSTHGFFLPDQEVKHEERGLDTADEHRAATLTTEGRPLENPLLRCGLLLAGCNQRTDETLATGDDGILTGLEIVGTDLRGTELVVLSACQTGLGDVHNGQGVAGLRQAFQLAGAQAVVSTLWSIPDQETVQLMSDFFANLSAGQSKADALRNAQLALIKSRRATTGGSAHPYFWAAFTLTGQ